MKKYTFTLPKNKDNANLYKEALMTRVVTAYPWMTVDSKNDYPSSDMGIEYAKEGDTITLGTSKAYDISWVPEIFMENKDLGMEIGINPETYTAKNINLETDFFAALQALNDYANEKYPFEKDYDFEDIFGTPVKIFDNFVQIGHEIVFIEPHSLDHLKSENTRKTIINITIKVKKMGLI